MFLRVNWYRTPITSVSQSPNVNILNVMNATLFAYSCVESIHAILINFQCAMSIALIKFTMKIEIALRWHCSTHKNLVNLHKVDNITNRIINKVYIALQCQWNVHVVNTENFMQTFVTLNIKLIFQRHFSWLFYQHTSMEM